MKRHAIYYLLTVLFSIFFLSCKEKEPAAPILPTISIEEVGMDITSITFSISTENAADAAYMVYEYDESYNPEVGDIFSRGTRISAMETLEYTVSDLAPNTSYTIAAAAKNEAGEYSEVATLTMSTAPSDGLFTFDVTVSEPTDVAVDVKIEPSDDEAYYVLDWVGASTYKGMSSAEIHAEYLRIFKGMAFNENKPLEEILSKNLLNGKYEGTIEDLFPLTDYALVVFGMDPKDGFLTSAVQQIPFTTAEQVLSIEVKVENIGAKSADVYVYPSNEEDSFIWLCEPTNKYPGMSLEEIAEAYTEANKQWLDMNMGLYYGAQEYPGYELMPGVDYYILAYGYEPGVGISTDVVGEFFSAEEGGDIETFEATIEITDVQGERIDYKITPNDETIYYMPGCMKTSEYSDELVKEDVPNFIREYWEQNKEYNPAYSIEEAVDALCHSGEQELYASPLEPETEYTIFAVPINSKGESGSVVVSVQTATANMGYSDADVTSEYIGAWDGPMLQEAGYFEGQNLTDKYIMAFRITKSPTCDTLKLKFWNGATELTDQELIDIIEPYWDAVYSGDDLEKLKYIYTTTPSYWPGSMTFCTLGFNSEGVRAAMGRTFVDVFWEDALLPLEEWEKLQNSSTSQSAVIPNNKTAETAVGNSTPRLMLSPKTSINNQL